LKKNYGVEEDKIFTVPLSIDFESISVRFPLKPLEDRQYDFVFAGRFAEIKRIDDLIFAISMVKSHKENVKGAIIGDGPLKERMREQIDRLGLNENIMLIGFTEEDRKYEILNDSRIFVLPSEREGFSLSTLEAMALGCVPIVSKPHYDEVFGVSHFVKDRLNGLYYDVGETEQLAMRIDELLEDSALLHKLSKNALECSKQYSQSIMQQKIYNAVEKLFE